MRSGTRSTWHGTRLANPAEIEAIRDRFRYSFVGTPETVARELRVFLEMTRADELIVSNPIFDHDARIRSLELTAEIRDTAVGREVSIG